MNPRAPLPVREAAREVALRISGAGHRALFAGGCVRDRLLGREPEDYDIATSAKPEEIQAIFPKARGVGEAFGVMLVRHGGHTFEVATFRKDGPYKDGRRPSSVTFSDEFEDAQRRDFTVNGIFEDPATAMPVDWVKGQDDIKARVIRAIGDPHARIAEDRLRMLRAVRFAARLGFEIDPATGAAVRAHSEELLSVSPERVGEEVRKMLAHPARARAALLVEGHALDGAIFGGRAGPGGVPRLASLSPDCDPTTALAAWYLDRLAREGAAVPRPDAADVERAVGALRQRLVLSNHETDGLRAALAAREALLGGFAALTHARRLRWMATAGFDPALELVRVDDPALAERIRADADRELPSRSLPAPLVDGNVLVSEGLRPGPEFKVLLDLAMDAQLEGRVTDRAGALDLIRASRAGGNPRP